MINYLKEISNINYERNVQILKQIDFLTALFKKIKLIMFFLSSALIISNEYQALNDRMIGDIDILVEKKIF